MIIFPAVDIRMGKAVRLRQGRKEDVTVFADNPLDVALRWQDQGAEYLHLVDLDAAFGDKPNFELIGQIAARLKIPVQAGGGIRDKDTAARCLDAGVSRLIIGTMALEDKKAFADLCRSFPGQIGVSLDAANGRLKSRGWLKDAGASVKDTVPELEDAGAAFIIYTDIERDGMRQGVNLNALRELLDLARVKVIVAGGVSCLDDVKAVHGLNAEVKIEGIISGRALYENSLSLPEALAWLKARKA